jgi:hypothetical protein
MSADQGPGVRVLEDPLTNKGTAFSEEERSGLGLRGLLPAVVETLEQQVHRRYRAYLRARATCTTTSSRNCSPSASGCKGHAARSDPAIAERVNGYVDTLDEAINKIRTSIFGLHQRYQAPAGLPARVMEIIDEHTAQLGFTAGIPRGSVQLRPARPRHRRHHLPGAPGRADHPRHHRQRPQSRYARTLERPVQHAPPRRTQRRHLPADHPGKWRHPPILDRPPALVTPARSGKRFGL